MSTINNSEISNENDLALIRASYEGDTTSVKNILKNNININATNSEGDTALNCACKRGHIKIVELLFASTHDINIESIDYDGNTPLICASINNYHEIVEFLLNMGADREAVGDDGKTALDATRELLYTEEVVNLLEYYIRAVPCAESPIHADENICNNTNIAVATLPVVFISETVLTNNNGGSSSSSSSSDNDD
jgi:ankyrin repeat protein